MIIIEDRMELALHIIELKKAKMLENNSNKNYKEYKSKVEKLMKEKEKIYMNDKKVIEKVLTEYLQDVKE